MQASQDEVTSPLFDFLNESYKSTREAPADWPSEAGIRVVYGLHKTSSHASRSKRNWRRSDIILLLADEKLRHKALGYRRFWGVLREYYKPGWGHKNQLTLPLFPTSSAFTKNNYRQSVRSIDFTFVGQEKSDRVAMLMAFQQEGRTHFKLNRSFNDQANGHSPKDLAKIYGDSIFVLCPFGNLNPDTFRVMEALFQGAIPVSVKMGQLDYFQFVYGPHHPFIIGDSWKDAHEQCRRLLENPTRLKEYQHRASAWFGQFLDTLSIDLGNMLNRNIEAEYLSTQWSLQRRSRFKPRVIWEFGLRFWFRPSIQKAQRQIDRLFVRIPPSLRS